LFSTLHSARSASLSVLVRDGADEGGAKLETADGASLEVRIKAGRTVMRSGTSPVAAKDFLGRFRSVLFTPEDLDMVRGEPALRRRSLDALGIQLRPRHRSIQRDFERALRQRNAALRDGRPQVAELYSQPLAAAAGPLLDARREIAGALRGPASELYAELAHRVGSDLERGRTMIGPHRDDIDITLDSRPARWYASRGEQRAITLALRLSELHLLDDAILMLDDVLSELDPERRRRVFDVTTGVQTIVTTTDMESFPASAKVDSRWRVTEGRLEEEAA
jgi:DNA replication and repair protein RecF